MHVVCDRRTNIIYLIHFFFFRSLRLTTHLRTHKYQIHTNFAMNFVTESRTTLNWFKALHDYFVSQKYLS